MKNLKLLFLIGVITLSVSSCNKKDKDDLTDYLNVFSLKDDIKFGIQMDSSIVNDPKQFPVLDKAQNPEAYAYMEGMMNAILSSSEIAHLNDFEWQIRIINSDIKNAFAAPGGKLYFYTGIIDYLDNASQLAGVLAHEIAHSDRRHSSQQMTKAYGAPLLFSLLLGNKAETTLGNIALELATGASKLKFSRNDEAESDEFSVKYLASIANVKNYDPKGILGFFEKMVNEENQSAGKPEFLSTHPNDENRVANVTEVWESLGSPSGEAFEQEYLEFKALLGLK